MSMQVMMEQCACGMPGERKHTLARQTFRITNIAFSPDGKILATASGREVRLWDPATGTSKQTLTVPSGSVNSVAFGPDGNVIATGGNDRTVRLWEVKTEELKQTLA